MNNIVVHLLVHLLKFQCILLKFHELFFQVVKVVHCFSKWINHVVTRLPHLINFCFKVFHFLHLFHHLLFFFLSLLLEFFSFLHLPLSLDFFLFLFLHFHDSVIHFYQQMRKLWVNFIDQIWKICRSFIINVLEKHNCWKILRKVMYFCLMQLSLQYINDLLFVCSLNLLC